MNKHMNEFFNHLSKTKRPPSSILQISIQSLNSTYQPSKLCRNVDDAKNYAADYALQQLSVPLDGMSR